MDFEWGSLVRILTAVLVMIFLFKKRRKAKPGPSKITTRRAKSDGSTFKRDYDPIEPS
jgi:hypothetical protein